MKLHIWKVATWENTIGKLPLGKIPLGSCHLGKYHWEVATWENTIGKLPLGKMSLGKYLTSFYSIYTGIALFIIANRNLISREIHLNLDKNSSFSHKCLFISVEQG